MLHARPGARTHRRPRPSRPSRHRGTATLSRRAKRPGILRQRQCLRRHHTMNTRRSTVSHMRRGRRQVRPTRERPRATKRRRAVRVRRTRRPMHQNRRLARTSRRCRFRTTNDRARRGPMGPRQVRRTTARRPRPRTTVPQSRPQTRIRKHRPRTTRCTRAMQMIGMYTTHLTRRPARPRQGARAVTGTQVRRPIRMSQPALTLGHTLTLLLRGKPIWARRIRVDRAPQPPRRLPRPRRRGTDRGAVPVRTTVRRARR